EIEAYALQCTSDESELLNKINRDTHINVLQPRMLSGAFQGRLLSMLSHMVNPVFILEIGTYTGYSALCLAEGLTKNGKLLTIDINEELETRCRSFFDESLYAQQIDMKIGDAMEIIPTIQEEIDLVFIDADKANYSNYFELCLPKLRTGGFMIVDNVLWSGKVLQEAKPNDIETEALQVFNEKLKNDSRVSQVLLPVRDGLTLIRKL
ncbi:MAG: caffeoyl-CoA O-methyltransferase, partial [Flavobacteriales bacterium]